ncbi:LysR family transcriptional regulator [Actinoplanes siamensis]|uniref:LysR family transcriptional regulator n=1 Tax=Actinoplanes siamensis TaxID=1223317 RepID=A0A919ND16_9ACTN|nr:LysR family transcriptional regulator [Actinoplanes siamensis]GIF08510.1 LysR family transcriptional regulator [Actinoplanes siamensis]
MELRHLRAFRAVARTLNFTRAAADLHYAQSSITEQVQALESELGAQLFDRSGRRLRLTPAGERLVGYAEKVLLLVEEARTVVPDQLDEPSGVLTVGALETLCAHRLPTMLSTYRSRRPKVRVAVREGNRGELYGAVSRGEIDISLTFGDPPADETLGSETLERDRLMIVTPVGHRLAGSPTLRMMDLAGEEFLATEQGCGFREMFDRSVAPLGADRPKVVAEMTSLAALCSCVASGMGAALLPEIAIRRHLDRSHVAAIPLVDADAQTKVTMTWLRRGESNPTLTAFLRTARSVIEAPAGHAA